MTVPLLEINHLQIDFTTQDGVSCAVNDVSFTIAPGETLGIVGESGSGKSVSTQAILRLTPSPPGFIRQGEILYQGRNLLDLDDVTLNSIRGGEISMIFQEPMTSLNPILTVENQITEALRIHVPGSTPKQQRQQVIDGLAAVGIPDPEKRLRSYPHELSGGMRQRVMIAMALICKPKLLIADEPTTALDVTIQAQILDIIKKRQQESNMALILITHDLGVIAENVDRVAIMYAGRIVESGPVEAIFNRPQHPYTRGLFNAVPAHDDSQVFDINSRLTTIRGMVPLLEKPPTSCSFANRCDYATTACENQLPPLKNYGEHHCVACLHCEKMR